MNKSHLTSYSRLRCRSIQAALLMLFSAFSGAAKPEGYEANTAVGAVASEVTTSLSSAEPTSRTLLAAANTNLGSSVNIQRLAPEDRAPAGAAAVSSADVYVDKLIDPSSPSPQPAFSGQNYDEPDSRIFHSINAAAYYRDTFIGNGDALDTGIEYIAYMPTHNYGDLRLNLVVLNEDENSFFNQGSDLAVGSITNKRQQGLQRYSIEQLGLPISENLSMDNILGTHRQSRNLPYRNRVSIVNQRFGANEPDILGFTTRLYSAHSGISASTGEIGDTHGTVLPGFVKTEGRVHRVLGHHVQDRFTLSGDLWNTTDFDYGDSNRVGARVNWQALWDYGLESTMTVASSDDSVAILLGGSQTRLSGFNQDAGIYYFEPEFIWIDTQIGDDFIGGYYRFNHNYRTLYYSGTLEHRRDGLKDDTRRERDTSLATFNGNYRIDRDSVLSSTYTFRDINDRSNLPNDISSKEHTLRGVYSLQHSRNTRSNFGATYREREGDTFQRLNYDIFHDFANDSTAELRLDYNQEDGEDFESDRYRVELAWQKYFLHGGSLALGTGYNFGEDQIGSDIGWNGYITYDVSIGRYWSVSAQMDYNRAEYETDDNLFEDDLFTDNQFIETESLTSEQFSALLNIRYSIGGNRSNGILASNGAARGSGQVIGRLFLDANGDGRAQPDERGLEGVTVYLNSIYPVITNARGEFEYAAVGPGNHHLFVDESILPLPWSLNGLEYTPVQVQLRSTSRVDIPVSKLQNR